MKLVTNRRSRRKPSRRSSHRRRRTSRTYQTAVPVTTRLGGLFGGQLSARKKTTRSLSGLAGAGSRLVAFLIALGMVGALVWFFVDYRFFVYGIEVDGAEMVSTDDVLQAAGVYEMSVFYVNRGKAVEQVRDRLLAVKSVSVRCGLPATVRVGVQEKAIAYRWLSGGQAYLVDEEGLVLGPDDGLHQDVTVIQDQDGGPLSAGDRVNEDAMQTVAQLAGLLPETTTFRYSNAMGVSLTGDRGLTVNFGDDRGLPAKVANMKAMLRELADGGHTAQFIDVRFVGSPYYR